MTSKPPVALILRAGPSIGHVVARTFASKGTKVGLVSRSLKEANSTSSQLNIPSNLDKTAMLPFSQDAKVFARTSEGPNQVLGSVIGHSHDLFVRKNKQGRNNLIRHQTIQPLEITVPASKDRGGETDRFTAWYSVISTPWQNLEKPN